MPCARETVSVRYLPTYSLELLEIARNAVACLGSTSTTHETLGMFNSLGFIVLLNVVAKINPYCS